MSLKAICREAFSVKELGSGDVVIEGWANKAVLDRGMDLIKKEAWELGNYEKNPIILFNHDTDKIIGKAIKFEARDEGLYVKCKLSKSKDPMVQYVKDLVQEGILNSFSVGFNAHDEQKSPDGVNEIKKAELYEVSIVSIPMNQESTFAVTTKSLAGKTYREAKRQILVEKGAMFASECQDKIYEMEQKEGFDKAAFMKELCEKMGCDEEELAKILAGMQEPTEEQMAAFKSCVEEKQAGDKVEEDPKKPDASNLPQESKEDVPPTKEDVPPAKEEKATTSVVAIKIPKSSVESAEAAGAWAEENGWKGGLVEEEGEYFVAYQEDPEQFSDMQEVPLDDESGVLSVIGVAKEQKKEKQAGGEKPGAPIGEVQKFDDNAYLQQSRQTNVLLSMMVEKLESIVQHMASMVKPVEAPKATEPDVEEPASEQEQEEVMKQLADLDKRIKMLGQ